MATPEQHLQHCWSHDCHRVHQFDIQRAAQLSNSAFYSAHNPHKMCSGSIVLPCVHSQNRLAPRMIQISVIRS